MHTRLAALTLLAVLAAACGDSDSQTTLTGPQPLQLSTRTTFASLHPTTLTPQLSRGGSCPLTEPYRATAALTISSDTDTVLHLSSVRLQFFDHLGAAAPAVTLTAPVLTSQYGTALVQARSARTFPIDYDFGCGTGRTGTIVVEVRVRDGHGRDRTMELRAEVK